MSTNRQIIESLLEEELALRDCDEPHAQIVIRSCNAWLGEDDFYRLRKLEKKEVK